MATDKVEIYNQALFNIGHAKRVISPTENTTERLNCEAVYEPRKRALLAMAKWSFAKTEVALSLTGFTPTGWEYEYFYPQGCLKALEIARASVQEKPIPFQTALRYDDTTGQETRVVWTNEAEASLLFLRNVQSPTVFTPSFDTALASFMSVDLSRVMTKSSKTPSEMFQLFQFHFQQAVLAGEAEAVEEPQPDAEWISNR